MSWRVAPIGVEIPGRYAFPSLRIEMSQNHEVRVQIGREEGYYNVLDLLEAVTHVRDVMEVPQ